MSLMNSLLFSGVIFGWPSFSIMLQQDGAFLDERCKRRVQEVGPSSAPKAPAVAACGAGGARCGRLISAHHFHSAKRLHSGATRRGSTSSTPPAFSSSRRRSL